MSYVALGLLSQDDVDQYDGDQTMQAATPYNTPRLIAAPELPHTEPTGFVPVDVSPSAPTPLPDAGGHSEPTPPRIWVDAPSTPPSTTPPSTTPPALPPSSSGGDTADTPAPGRWIAPRSRGNDVSTPYDPTPGTGEIIAPPGAPTVAEVAAADAAAAGPSMKTWLIAGGLGLAALYLLGGNHNA